MMRRNTITRLVPALLAAFLTLGACSDDGPAEEAGEAADDAAEEAEESAEEVTE
jgi:hypothetical protein